MKGPSLHLFNHNDPQENFINDIDNFKELSTKDIKEIIDLCTQYYAEELSEKWDEYLESCKNEEEKNIKNSVLGVIYFFLKELITGNVNKEELKQDFKVLKIDEEIFEHIDSNLKNNRDFIEEILLYNQPYRNKVNDIVWRIDNQNIGGFLQRKIAIVEFNYTYKEKNKSVILEFNSDELDDLVTIINKIKKRI